MNLSLVASQLMSELCFVTLMKSLRTSSSDGESVSGMRYKSREECRSLEMSSPESRNLTTSKHFTRF